MSFHNSYDTLIVIVFVNIKVIGVYILSGSPEHVVLGDNVTVTLTCVVDDNYKLVTWSKDSIYVASIRNECELGNGADTTYNYTCDVDNNIYHLIIPPNVKVYNAWCGGVFRL